MPPDTPHRRPPGHAQAQGGPTPSHFCLGALGVGYFSTNFFAHEIPCQPCNPPFLARILSMPLSILICAALCPTRRPPSACSRRHTCNQHATHSTSHRVHSSVARAADCRSAGPWFKSGCALRRLLRCASCLLIGDARSTPPDTPS